MTKYSSSSGYSNYEAIMAAFMLLGIGLLIANSIDIFLWKIVAIAVSIITFLLILLSQRKRIFEIKFLEDNIQIEYLYPDRKIVIPYAELLEIDFLSTTRSPDRNRIKFKTKNEICTLKFVTVSESDEYIEFIKWLKSKNEKLKLNVFPSDHIMNHKIQEIYGFKYRKFIKKTL